MARKKKSTPSRPEVEPGKPIEAAVLALEDRVARVRLLESGQETFLRAPLDAVPGEIATFVLEKLGTHRKQPCLIAKRTEVRLDVPALRLEPLRLKDLGTWDPATHDWGEGGSHPEWARSIVAAGPRLQSGLEDIVQSRGISLVDDAGVALPNPLLSAMMAMEEGDLGLALQIHDALLAADLRCLEAHAFLGTCRFDHDPMGSLRHYSVGVGIAELSLGAGWNGVLPWSWLENRPFLRCLHGQGLGLWRAGRVEEAKGVFERMLWLNPTDNQGARLLVADIAAGRAWRPA